MMPEPMNSLEAWLEGDRARCLSVLQSTGSVKPDPESRFYLARQAARLGEVELGNEFLAQSIAGGYWITAALQSDPWLEAMRATDRFRELLASAQDLEARSRREFQAAGGDEVLALGVECAKQDHVTLA